ncbi:WHG domain-containing protein [Micromonospora sp. NPDC051296]|uniref:TetR/AcrR family transcriptional regulator n=1 Tax=Micromonospora sp. NPDC051296 TaxID=3155046 RepID=UPI003431A3EC
MNRREEIIDVAQRLLEAEGPESLTMRRLADELGIQAPSLYKHVAGKPEIEAALQQRALRRLAEALAGTTDLATLAAGYRRWALAHPRLYELSTRQPLARDRLEAGVEAEAAAALLRLTDGDLPTARAIWGMAHGLVDLELAGRFPPGADLDAVWQQAVATFATAPASRARHASGAAGRTDPGAPEGRASG